MPGVVSLERVVSAGDRLAYPLTYWNGTGAFAAIGLVLAAGLAGDPGRPRALRAAAAATGPLLGLAVYLTFSRGALGALAAGSPGCWSRSRRPPPSCAAALVVGGSGALAAAATLALPAIETQASGSGQGAAMLALLVALGGGRRLAGAPRGADGPARAAARAWRSGCSSSPSRARCWRWPRPSAAAAPTHRRPAPGRLASVQSNRYEYWRVALRSFGDHPLLGEGSGGFRVVWLRERPFRESVRDAHSLYLETAAELGLAGLACLLALFGGLGAGAVRAHRRAGPATAPAIAAMATWAVHAGLDWDWELPALSLLALVLAARLLATLEPDAPPEAATVPPAA